MKFSIQDMRRTMRPHYAPPASQFRHLSIFHTRSVWLVRMFYVVSVAYSYNFIGNIFHKDPDAAYFLWPVAWLEVGNLKQYMVAIPIVLFLVNCALMVDHGSRALRILFSALCLFAAAIDNSYGAINHGWHEWFWISFLLIFLPSRKAMDTRSYQLATVSNLVYVQTMLMLFYTMAGSAKLIAGLEALATGQGGNFAPLGFASLIAERMLHGHGETILGWIFLDWPYLGFPLFSLLILIQSASIIVAFIPRLHRIWGLLLIMFHFGTALLMDIYFPSHVLWLAIFLVLSPFHIGARDRRQFSH